MASQLPLPLILSLSDDSTRGVNEDPDGTS